VNKENLKCAEEQKNCANFVQVSPCRFKNLSNINVMFRCNCEPTLHSGKERQQTIWTKYW